MRRLHPELAEKEMENRGAKRANSGVEELLSLFPDGLTVPAIAAGIGWKVEGTRPYLSGLKKQGRIQNTVRGLWKLATPVETTKPSSKGNSVCSTCGGRRWVEVKPGDTGAYKRCPDCQKERA